MCMLSRSEFERIEIQTFHRRERRLAGWSAVDERLNGNTPRFTAAELQPQLLPAFQLGVVNFACEFLLLSLRP
jgi:hypothetical protein